MVDASFGLFHLYLFVSMYKNRKAKVQLFGVETWVGFRLERQESYESYEKQDEYTTQSASWEASM